MILGQKSSQFSITFHSLEATNFKAIFVGRTRIHDGQFSRKPTTPNFEFDSTLDKNLIDKQYIYRRPSTKHICEHVVTYYNNQTSQFQSLLVHKTSLRDHVHLEQLNQKKISKKGGVWVDFGRKRSKVHRLEHDSDISDDENSAAKEEIVEERNFQVSILDIPDELITDAFVPNQELDLIRPLRVTAIARLFVPRYQFQLFFIFFIIIFYYLFLKNSFKTLSSFEISYNSIIYSSMIFFEFINFII